MYFLLHLVLQYAAVRWMQNVCELHQNAAHQHHELRSFKNPTRKPKSKTHPFFEKKKKIPNEMTTKPSF
jgi:hypothetical protein